MIAGPGCPVCVVPTVAIDRAVELALNGVIVTTFGDLMRVPATRMSLFEARARGGDVRVVYSASDAVEIARRNPDREVVFLSVGFETTAPTTASEILRGVPENFSVMCYHRLIPPAMELLLGVGDLQIDGFICPGHVAAIIGVKAFRVFAEAYKMPTVVAGFEPNDVLLAILMLLRQLRDGEARCENEYARLVRYEGNVKAQRRMKEVYNVSPAYWRGIGRIPDSGLTLKKEFERLDAEKKFEFSPMKHLDLNPGCNCHLVMIGKIYPPECRLFGKVCTPQRPYGPCMVSVEGTCYIFYKYGGQPRI
ncbi:MAG: hydrogenase formation protein HypD [Candidatus Freyarchaeota archaeon]|nr:hydrogenase formation protein HypD [Candidatus Freyrarchaeum guaymaensis]